MSDILAEICAQKRLDVAAAKAAVPQAALERRLASAPPVRDFIGALGDAVARGAYGLIAEIKKASPSHGLIRPEFSPAALAQAYESAGAACLSVLTEGPYFQGHPDHLIAARAATNRPVLRKDFTLDAYQVIEARAIGADAILLIMAALDDDTARTLEALAHSLGLAVLIEVHDADELDRALRLTSPLIGVNNRNLKSLKTDLTTTERLAAALPADRLLVSESGLQNKADLDRMAMVGAKRFLVGESLLRTGDVARATRLLLTGQP